MQRRVPVRWMSWRPGLLVKGDDHYDYQDDVDDDDGDQDDDQDYDDGDGDQDDKNDEDDHGDHYDNQDDQDDVEDDDGDGDFQNCSSQLNFAKIWWYHQSCTSFSCVRDTECTFDSDCFGAQVDLTLVSVSECFLSYFQTSFQYQNISYHISKEWDDKLSIPR